MLLQGAQMGAGGGAKPPLAPLTLTTVNELCSQNNAVRCKFFVTRQTRTACELPTD